MAEELLPIQENEYKELLRQAVAVLESARASVAFHLAVQPAEIQLFEDEHSERKTEESQQDWLKRGKSQKASFYWCQ